MSVIKEAFELLMSSAPAVIYVVTFLFGICVGSFLNVCIFRMPEGESIVVVPSHCMSCGKKLHWYELFPLFSWLALRGKCLGCKSKISAQYPLIEATNGLLWLLVLWVKGISLDTLLCMAFFSVLLVISVIDFRIREIETGTIVFIGILAVLRTILYREKWLDHILGIVVMAAAFLILIFITNGKAMGGGDFKLVAVCGLYIGLKMSILALAIACVAGSIIHLALMAIKKVGHDLPFAPYLSLGYAVCALWGAEIWQLYMNFLKA